MDDFAFYLLLILEITFLSRLEYIKWGTLVTPFNVLAMPFGFICLLSIVYSLSYPGVKDFYFPSLIVWLVGLAFFYFPTSLIQVKPNLRNPSACIKESNNDDFYKMLYVITMLLVIIALSKIRSIGSQFIIGTDEFSEKIGGANGIFAHIFIFLEIMFAFFMYKLDRYHKLAIIPLLLILFVSVAQASKTHILAPLFMGIFTRIITGKTKLSVKIAIIILLTGVSVFCGIYFISLVLSAGTSYEGYSHFVAMHFLDYFLGGSLSFSLDYKYGILEPDMTSALVHPFNNVYGKITGVTEHYTIVNPISIYMGELGSTNVRTFFGTIYAYSHSYVVLILLALFMSVLVYSVYYWAYTRRNLFLAMATSSNLTYLVFGSFFDFYWIHIYPYEIVVICIVLYILSVNNGITRKRASTTC